MAETTVNTPNGEIVVTHPATATDEQILRYAESQTIGRRTELEIIDHTAEATPTEGGIENFFSGLGAGLADVKLGVQQLSSDIAASLPPTFMTAAASARAPELQEAVGNKRELDQPLDSTKSGFSGKIGGNLLASLPAAFIPGANTGLGATLIGGLLGTLQPSESIEEKTLNTLTGGAGGFAGQRLGSILFRGANPQITSSASTGRSSASANVSGNPSVGVSGGGSGFGTVGDDVSAGLTAGQQLAADRGSALGMRLTPGQQTGSRALQQLESKLSSQPITSGPFNAIKDNNQRVLNRTWANAIGIEGDDLSSPVLAESFDRLSDVFESMPQRIGTQDIDAGSALRLLASLQDETLGVTAKPVLNNPLVKEFIKLAETGEATGSQLRSLTSRLGKRINNEFTSLSGDRELARSLLQLKNTVDDVIEGGLSAADQDAYRIARNQYRHYTLLTQRVNVLDPSSGNINGVSLAKLLQTKDKAGFLRGGNQSAQYNATRFAQAFKDIMGDSGTATRSMTNNPIEAVASLPFNIASRAYTSPASVSAINAGNRVLNDLGSLLGPASNPSVTGLLGANVALQTGR